MTFGTRVTPATGTVSRRFRGHDDRVVTAVLDRAGRRAATSSRDGTVKLWDAATGDLALALPANSDRVIGLAFSPDGTRLAVGGRDGRVTVWDLAGPTQVLTLMLHTASVEAIAWKCCIDRDGIEIAAPVPMVD